MSNWKSFEKAMDELSPLKGGPGSGNFGHHGRPGEIGGSSGAGASLHHNELVRAGLKPPTTRYGYYEHPSGLKAKASRDGTWIFSQVGPHRLIHREQNDVAEQLGHLIARETS